MEAKVHNTFVHDKVIFDTFNQSLLSIQSVRYNKLPWIKQERAYSVNKFDLITLKNVLKEGKEKVEKWTMINAG